MNAPENQPLKHITDGSAPAFTVDWGYDSPISPQTPTEKSWYLCFRNEEDAKEFASWYFDEDQKYRIYPGPVKLHPTPKE